MNRIIINIISVVVAAFCSIQAYAVSLPTSSYQPMSSYSTTPSVGFSSMTNPGLPQTSYTSSSTDYSDCQKTSESDVTTCPTCCFEKMQLCENPDPNYCFESVYVPCFNSCNDTHSLPIPDAVPYLLALSAAYAAVLYAKKRKEQQA